MNIKFIICIIIGIILYILINKIEGLTCRGPLDVALGNPNPSARLDRLNRGSLPFFPKNNVMVARRVDGRNRYITRTSQNARWSNNDSLTLICSRGLKDESQEKLAPYTPLTIEGNNLTCHRPSKKAIFYRIHGNIATHLRDPLIHGSKKSSFTQIPKKMQLIFYINHGDCHSSAGLISIFSIHDILSGIYNGVDISSPTRNLLIQPQPGGNSLFDKGFSELESINGIYMLSIDGNNVLTELKTPRRPGSTDLVVFNLSQDNVYSMTCNAAFFSNQNIPQIFTKLYGFRNINLLHAIGPYSGTFPIIDFSDNDDRLGNIIATYPNTYPNVFVLENYVSVETDELQTVTFTYNIERMEVLKDLIKELISSQSVSVSISYLSTTFKSSDSFRRLFNGNDEIELPIFCLSILSHPYFVNPIETTYALPGGQYTSQDLIDLIFDIIGQITYDHDSVVKSVYYRNMRSLGMSDDEIDTFLSQCNFLYTQTNIIYSIPEDYPLLPFMRLWEPWNYPTTHTRDHTIYKWSMQTFLLLIQLFKQDEGEAIDVHSFTCLSGIGDEITTNNAKMDYSWQYAYSNEEANSQDKHIGPDCQRPVCPQLEDEINSNLVELGKGEFIVDSQSFSRENRHPKSKQIIYTKNDDQGREITIDRSYIEPTGITVKCKDRQEITEKLICKYNEAFLGNELNYNQSILELDPSRCNGQSILDINVLGPSLLSVSQSRVTPVSSVCGVALKFNHF